MSKDFFSCFEHLQQVFCDLLLWLWNNHKSVSAQCSSLFLSLIASISSTAKYGRKIFDQNTESEEIVL